VGRGESRHPTDEQLVARYFDASAADDYLELHLFRCRACAVRRQELALALDADHDRTLAAADRYFDEARLARQRRAVLGRIATPQGRVLRFREAPPPAHAILRAVRRSRRWTASAAAAVLMLSVGAGTGWWLDGRAPSPMTPGTYHSLPTFASAVLGHEHQDAVLSAIDAALRGPQTPELMALDALTPRAGEQPIP
jgi:hypothetical protein